jgi:hypothetical protein
MEGKKRGFSCFITKINKILIFKILIDLEQILINCNWWWILIQFFKNKFMALIKILIKFWGFSCFNAKNN